jgi:hypothetical protein
LWRAATSSLLILLLAGCATTPIPGSYAVDVPRAGTTDTPSEEIMNERSKRIVEVFNGLNQETMDILHGFYHPDVHFIDPLGEIHGRADIRKYYENMYHTVQEIRFDFTDEVVTGDTHVAVWTMHLKAAGLNGGKPVVLDGNSVIKFGEDDLVVYHRDYFDMGAFVYQHVPVLGWAVRKVNDKLKH